MELKRRDLLGLAAVASSATITRQGLRAQEASGVANVEAPTYKAKVEKLFNSHPGSEFKRNKDKNISGCMAKPFRMPWIFTLSISRLREDRRRFPHVRWVGASESPSDPLSSSHRCPALPEDHARKDSCRRRP